MARVDPPYDFIAQGLIAGEVIPFFGAAASAVYRPADVPWAPGRPFMPFGGELAMSLAAAAKYPATNKVYEAALSEVLQTLQAIAPGVSPAQAQAALEPVLRRHLGGPPDLAIVASWAEHVQGHRRAVDRKLHQSFAVDCQPGLLHAVLGAIEGVRLYITTNYDDLIEQALAPRQPHVLVDRGEKGLWLSVAGGAPQAVAATGNELYELLDDPVSHKPAHPILFKMHGGVDKSDPRNDCYLVTEEDYVDFLGRTGGGYVPPYITGLLQGKDLLFLGYSLADWNVRVILRKLLRQATQAVKFWAIVSGHSDVEQELWQARDLRIYPMDLLAFAEELANELTLHR
jgi:hypothetical protein